MIIGAGFAGLYALYKIRRMGLEALALEAAASVGGTWYANRYPGARVDIQSLDYSFSSRRSCSRSGAGPSVTPHNPSCFATPITLPTGSACATA